MFVRYRAVNPLLGVYYGIFTAAFVGLGIFLLILEYMGLIGGHLVYALSLAAFFLAGSIAVASSTKVIDEFFLSGRRVPAGLNGLVIFVVALGGAGLSGIMGAVFFWGIDGFGLMLGLLAGCVLAGILFAAFVRKAGSNTLATFFAIRYQSEKIGIFIGFFLLIPSVFFALAELSILKTIGPFVFGVSAELCLLFTVGIVLLILLPGGVRSMGWAQCALAIVVVVGLLVPLVLLSLKYTNLPLAQLTYGSLIDDIAKFEDVSGKDGAQSIEGVGVLMGGLPQHIQHSFLGGLRPFDLFEKLAMFFLVAAGIAGMPALLMRGGVTSDVGQARKSYAWGAAFLGVIIFTVPAYVIFFRYLVFDPQVTISMAALPSWTESLQAMGLFDAQDVNGDGQMAAREMLLARDGVMAGLPLISNFYQILQSLTFAALMTAAVAGLLARVMVLGQYFVRDLHLKKGSIDLDVIDRKTLFWSRVGLIVISCLLGVVASHFQFDAFQMFVAGLLFCALGVFPMMVLSLWWNGMGRFAIVTCLLIGFLCSCFILYASDFGRQDLYLGLSLFEAGAVGIVLVVLCTLLVAKLGPSPLAPEIEALNDIRTPGGEALYDRMLRLAMPRRTGGQS